LRTKWAEKQIFLTPSPTLQPETLGWFFSTLIHLPLLDPFLDHRIHPEDLGIVRNKKLLNNTC